MKFSAAQDLVSSEPMLYRDPYAMTNRMYGDAKVEYVPDPYWGSYMEQRGGLNGFGDPISAAIGAGLAAVGALANAFQPPQELKLTLPAPQLPQPPQSQIPAPLLYVGVGLGGLLLVGGLYAVLRKK